MNCPDCKAEIERKYGLPGLTSICLKCQKQWVMCLGKLVSKDEFHKRADKFNE